MADVQGKIATGTPVPSWCPMGTGLAAMAAIVALAGWLFSKREL
ncbi:hypothetical protein HMPREF9622_00140 [Cutibacterium modestum HL037PA3]|uniref:LPXTG-motif cell wall anchor domain protein n=1 Tax=Cutibacterium modestum HL044PA1 TaxID=765109 RepID=A0ABP2K3L0_9ACTN|nr:hypothetical protein HMPREF9621_00118 [Cutibacterium modestum HL037PA2]EFS91390.1 hypothetical protein HMPREF9607_02683 [Cutibacterium modestum HL044PA1]EFT16598.1 hypothetical protein HMPREF9622_00140 [Cutibacterium modestum HL037PA3]EGG27590.1 hypothetical protein PA08_0549 [Cutibacterium modestum P08]